MWKVWYNVDVPGALFKSKRGVREDAFNAIFRVPERGKFVRSVTIICSTRKLIGERNPSDDPEMERMLQKILSLMPNVHSIGVLIVIGNSPLSPEREEELKRLRVIDARCIQRWISNQLVIRRIKLIHGRLENILPLISWCPRATHFSIGLTQQDLSKLESMSFPVIPPTDLSLLTDLEINIQALPYLAPNLRNVVNIRFHNILTYPSEIVIYAVGRALRDAKKVHTLQFPSLSTRAVGDLLKGFGPIESLRVIVERGKKVYNDPSRGEDWARDLRYAIEQAPNLETYVISTTSEFPYDTRQNVLDLAKRLSWLMPYSKYPLFRQLVFDVVLSAGERREGWTVERDRQGRWRAILVPGGMNAWIPSF